MFNKDRVVCPLLGSTLLPDPLGLSLSKAERNLSQTSQLQAVGAGPQAAGGAGGSPSPKATGSGNQ